MEAIDSQLDGLSRVVIALMKGVLYRESDAKLWQVLLNLQARVRDYVSVLGLTLMLDEAEGYAWLYTREASEGEEVLPRLVVRRQLSYPVSLIIALLRRKLAEHDALGGDTRLILSREEVVEMVRTFLPAGTNEARLVDQIASPQPVSPDRLDEIGGRSHQFRARAYARGRRSAAPNRRPDRSFQ